MAKQLRFLKYAPGEPPERINVSANVLAEFLIVKTAPGLSAFERQFGHVFNGLELANILRDAMAAARDARRRLSGLKLQLELKRIVGETIGHCPLPVKISVAEIIEGRTIISEVPESLPALLVDLALLDITHETRCCEHGCDKAIPKRKQYCKLHDTREARHRRSGKPRQKRKCAAIPPHKTKINLQE